MAQGHIHLDLKAFSCPICLELLNDAVTIPCGHNYCFGCIKNHWDREETKHSCPQCRNEFVPRPELLKNTMLADLVEQLRQSGFQAAPADHCYARAGDVACDICTGRKLKALKSCLVCLVSYCENHLQPHRESPAFAEHQLVEPSKTLQENTCSQHNELMKMFCRSDQQCICSLCSVDEHKGHNIVSVAAERREKQKKLQKTKQSIQQTIQDREGELKELQQEATNINSSADEAVEHSKKIYTELISLMEKRRSEVEQQIRSQQEAEVRRVKELMEKLEWELSELRSNAAELRQLSLTEDHTHFLLNYSSASLLAASTHTANLHKRPCFYFENLTTVVSNFNQNMQQLLKDTWRKKSLPYVDVLLSAEPKTRQEFLRYSCALSLDPNTAHRELVLSDGNRRATDVSYYQPYPDHPDRFRKFCQVLSRESLTGRCYWEVNVRLGAVRVAVAYKNISRAGDESEFGSKNQSWALYCKNPKYKFRSDGVWSKVSGPWSDTVGVFLDRRAGLLSFYSVSDSMTLLHTVHTSFTQPLHAGLGVHWFDGGYAELV